MSKQVLQLLRAISFLEKDNSVANLAVVPEAQLKQRLAYYYESRKRAADRELSDLPALDTPRLRTDKQPISGQFH